MICGYPPFNGSDEDEILKNVEKGSYSFESYEWENVSFEGKSFIKRLLERDINKRLTAEEALNDPWIKYGSTKPQLDKKLAANAFSNLKKFRVKLFK